MGTYRVPWHPRYFDENPTFNIASFDSVPVAFIAIMQTISFDTWLGLGSGLGLALTLALALALALALTLTLTLTRTVCMYALMDAFSPLAFVFFWLIVICGGFSPHL